MQLRGDGKDSIIEPLIVFCLNLLCFVCIVCLCITGASLGNYRPVRLTSVPGKIVEKIIVGVTEKHLEGSTALVTANVGS